MSDEKEEVTKNSKKEPAAPDKVALSFATGFVILRTRKYRRNLLFGLTALAMFLVFGGMVILGDALMKKPVAFLIFWALVFLLVIFIIWLAIYDMLIVRREHRAKMDSLELELAVAAEEARKLAAEEKAKLQAEEKDENESTGSD